MHGDRGGEEPDAGCEDAGDDEYGRSEFAERESVAFAEEIVCGFEVTGVVARNEDKRNEEPSDEIADGDLEERHIGRVGESGDADEGECACFAGDDGEAD